MKDVVYVFTGQGSQHPGMGKSLYDAYDAAKIIFNQANEYTGMDIKGLCFEGSKEEQKLTKNTQPMIFTLEVAAFEVFSELASQHIVKAAAGHSLGEYGALYSAGSIYFKDCVELVKKRGEIMSDVGGYLAAIDNIESDKVDDLLEEFNDVQAALYNHPKQTIVGSGSKEEIEDFIVEAKANRARSRGLLPVSDAFHTSLYAERSDEYRKMLKNIDFKLPTFSVYSNFGPHKYSEKKDFAEYLSRQLEQPVMWDSIMSSIQDILPETIVEFGPKPIVKGFFMKKDKEFFKNRLVFVGDEESLEKTLEKLI